MSMIILQTPCLGSDLCVFLLYLDPLPLVPASQPDLLLNTASNEAQYPLSGHVHRPCLPPPGFANIAGLDF